MKKVLLCIMDGVGISDRVLGNAYLMANTPVLDRVWNEYPHMMLHAEGEYVGLPSGQMGNSEVGHMAIGTGRVIYQSLERINKSILDKTFFENRELLDAINYVKMNETRVHLVGLLSDGGVHSHINHLLSLIDMCKMNNVKNVYIHVITDGRDTAVDSGIEYIKILEEKIKDIPGYEIATLCGRFYMMDRDNRYDRVKMAYEMLTLGVGEEFDKASVAWKNNQDEGITDEFIKSAIIDKNGMIRDNDAVIGFNFRPDRMRELFAALTNKDFECFDRKIINGLKVVTMMPISDEAIVTNVFSREEVNNTLGWVIASNGLKQLRIAETEKYAHVTYFFDGGRELELDNCKKILVPSPKVSTYDMAPEMSADKITERLINEFDNENDLIVLNYANGDMVGHTGVFDVGIKAMESVDKNIGRLLDKIDMDKYMVIITADHGNCECMINDDLSVNTMHTSNLVPLIVLDKDVKLKKEVGSLTDIAPTILSVMGLKIPNDMNGEVLFDE